MNDSTRSVLHEVMEQQTLSIAKAGIICQLNARTSILAAANPAESQWNKNKTIIDNVQLPHTLMSRFDLIFLILDPQDEVFDRRLASHLVSLYYATAQDEDDTLFDMSILRDYLAYAKEHIQPTLSEEAQQRLIQAYVDMRKVGAGRGQISAYPRQLESLIRLSEAHAKVRFSKVVGVEDVEEAWRLHREALKQSATDPLSGKIDVGILTTGLSTAARKKRAELVATIKELLKKKGKIPTISWQKLFSEIKESSQIVSLAKKERNETKKLNELGLKCFDLFSFGSISHSARVTQVENTIHFAVQRIFFRIFAVLGKKYAENGKDKNVFVATHFRFHSRFLFFYGSSST